MEVFKWLVWVLLILTIVAIVFRGSLFRLTVTYRSIGLRANYTATEETLIQLINQKVAGQINLDIRQIIRLSLSLTSKQLNYVTPNDNIDPNQMMTSRSADCVGYAAFFSTTCNYLLEKYKLADTWTARPQVGYIYFLGINIHKYFHTPFFKDHDFATIENKMTGQTFTVDPSINDYLRIDFVTFNPEKLTEYNS